MMPRMGADYDRNYDFAPQGGDGAKRREWGKTLRRLPMRKPGLEPGRVAPQDPKSCASTNSATFAESQTEATGRPPTGPAVEDGLPCVRPLTLSPPAAG